MGRKQSFKTLLEGICLFLLTLSPGVSLYLIVLLLIFFSIEPDKVFAKTLRLEMMNVKSCHSLLELHVPITDRYLWKLARDVIPFSQQKKIGIICHPLILPFFRGQTAVILFTPSP